MRILAYFEVGNTSGGYGTVSIYRDGTNDTWQVTYGLLQTTQQGKLPMLLKQYVSNKGEYSDRLKKFAPYTSQNLYRNEEFLTILRMAGDDPIMQQTQDTFFEVNYLSKAEKWCKDNGFILPLSYLVIADSFIHSGSILEVIRNRFSEVPPARGGDEKEWITCYCQERLEWLSKHRREILRKTVYRPNCFLAQIQKNNWDLSKPVSANGRIIK